MTTLVNCVKTMFEKESLVFEWNYLLHGHWITAFNYSLDESLAEFFVLAVVNQAVG